MFILAKATISGVNIITTTNSTVASQLQRSNRFAIDCSPRTLRFLNKTYGKFV
jgi:hypothetical protein